MGNCVALSSALEAGLAGLILGGIVGAVAQVTTFCSVGAVADIVLAKDWRRMRSWLMAAAVALLGTQALSALGLADLTGTPYGLPPAAWTGVALGSIAFGFGMAQAGGCVQRALVRLGSGSLKSAATLALIAVTAAATLRLMPHPEAHTVTLPHAFALALSLAVGGGAIAFCLSDAWFRQSPRHLWGGAAIGACVAAAWVFADGRRGFNLLMDLGVATAAPAGIALPISIFGTAALIGVALGATAAAAVRGDLYTDRFVDRDDLKRHVIGGVLMGIGGAFAYGCSFGQGLAGFSTLSASAVIAMLGMAAGCLWGVRTLEAGTTWGGLKLLFGAR
jgi:uncharacterized membrane protein YedE/YeeE